MPRSIAFSLSVLLGAALVAAACGGGSKKDAAATSGAATQPAKTAAATSGATSAAKAPGSATPATAATTAATAAPASTPVPAATQAGPAPTGNTLNETQAKALVDAASLKPADIGTDWVITTDTPQDNAVAAATDPNGGASFERCGRLAGRLLTNGPKDTVSAYLGGTIVAAFSQLTVYATAAGAADCSAEGAARFAQPGALAKAFGTVFVNPDAVVVKQLDYPTVGDGSFAAALTGDINAAGTVVQLQIVFVGFLKGNTSAVVGVAYAPLTMPSTKELKPFVDLVLQRIAANQ